MSNLPPEILAGLDKRFSKRKPTINPSVRKVACPICKSKGIKEGNFYRYTDGHWSKCQVCGFSGILPN